MRYKYVFVIVGFCLSFCAPKRVMKPDFPQEIELAYFKKSLGGLETPESEIQFFVKFKEPLSSEITLKKIYFRKHEIPFEQYEKNTFVAKFFKKSINVDLILESDSLKEYGNQAPIMKYTSLDLKPNEAILEYEIKRNIRYFKISQVKENKMILHP